MYARVIINQISNKTDKLYDYGIPENMDVTVGSRVIVPFGRGNKNIEAYVMYLSETTSAANIKEIIRPSGENVFDEKMRDLIYVMRQKYLCRYIDLLHTIIPDGIAVRPEKWVVYDENVRAEFSEKENEIIGKIRDNGGAVRYYSFIDDEGGSVKNTVDKLVREGALKTQYRESVKITESTLRVVSLADSAENSGRMLSLLKRAPVQAKMIEILSTADFLSLPDLLQFSGGSYSAVKSLEKKGFITFSEIEVFRNPVNSAPPQTTPAPELTKCQQNAFDKILAGREKNKPYLLHGVTGSGKTEIYMRVIEHIISEGKTAVMLVPEISLTPQTVRRFYSRFGARIAVLHSRLSLGERYDEWRRIKSGKADIVIGARSAVFAPLDNIGVIIVDEEHEQSYKSERSPRYHTRDIVEFRARQYGSMIIYASATPSVESCYKAETGEYIYVAMDERIHGRSMPETFIVDMRAELADGNRSMISRQLKGEIEKNLARGEQTILFLNRRGFSTFVLCRNCGYEARCPNCSISLTYHKFDDSLRCHYCGYARKNYIQCPECGSKYIRYFGGGTQKVEEEVHSLFPNASTIRMDIDTTGRKESHEKILSSFRNEHIDILIGTQMVSKGLDFDNVTLVGIISADTMLNIDDFRSAERTFAMLEQTSGRAGRAEKPGRSVIQTYNPENQAVEMVKTHDYRSFYKSEICMRKAMWYPPYCEIVSILISGSSDNVTVQAARFVKNSLRLLERLEQRTMVLGPVPAYISKINNKYRYRIMIKCENSDGINKVLAKMLKAVDSNEKYERISVIVDKNSNTMY